MVGLGVRGVERQLQKLAHYLLVYVHMGRPYGTESSPRKIWLPYPFFDMFRKHQSLLVSSETAVNESFFI